MAFVFYPDGKNKTVKNLGWLRAHSAEVSHFQVATQLVGKYGKGEGLLNAICRDGKRFSNSWASDKLMLIWLDRPVFQGLPITVDGALYAIGDQAYRIAVKGMV